LLRIDENEKCRLHVGGVLMLNVMEVDGGGVLFQFLIGCEVEVFEWGWDGV